MEKAIPRGENIIGNKFSKLASDVLRSYSPSLMKELEGQFHKATKEEVDEAMQLAAKAFKIYRHTSGSMKAKFLNAIADEILKLGDALIERAMQETSLPKGRITGERGRTVNQLRMFAKLVEEGSWVEATIDTAIPERQPFPKADIRKMLVPTGPVVVFTASNFPLAFSTAGGDTAAALAAGCPVVVKAHESHLGTNALVAGAIQLAAQNTGMPEGVFSSLNGTGPELGQQLVRHPLAKSVAFTGSYRAGKALFDAAAERAEPIPVFAEMGSINPVVLLPEALKKDAEGLSLKYSGSVTLGVGQFCTNPGLLIGLKSDGLDYFIKRLSENLSGFIPTAMLNKNVCKNFEASKQHLLQQKGVQLEGEAPKNGASELLAFAGVASVEAIDFLTNKNMQEEIFGPFTLVVECNTKDEMMAVIQNLKGQLTATIMGEEEEFVNHSDLIFELKEKAGRVIFNGVPTGVEVCHSMQHGGPFPATTDGRFTSVGTAAIKRFVRPVAFQNWQQSLLPVELKNENILGIQRMVDGTWTNGKIS